MKNVVFGGRKPLFNTHGKFWMKVFRTSTTLIRFFAGIELYSHLCARQRGKTTDLIIAYDGLYIYKRWVLLNRCLSDVQILLYMFIHCCTSSDIVVLDQVWFYLLFIVGLVQMWVVALVLTWLRIFRHACSGSDVVAQDDRTN